MARWSSVVGRGAHRRARRSSWSAMCSMSGLLGSKAPPHQESMCWCSSWVGSAIAARNSAWPGARPRPRAAAARCGDELRVESLRVGLADALDADDVSHVAKVVEIMNRPGAGILDDVEERGLRPVARPRSRDRGRPACATSPELVEMAVGPAHRRLQDEVQPVEADLSGTSSRRITAGSTSSSVTLRRAMAAGYSCGDGRGVAPPRPFPRQEFGEPREGRSPMRARTSASQACGSRSLSLAVVISVYMKAALSPPRSEPQNSQALRPRATPRSARSAALFVRTDPAVLEEPGESVPALEHVVHRLGHAGVAGEAFALAPHPALEIGNRGAVHSRRGEAGGAVGAVDRALEVEDRINEPHRLQRER